MKTIKESIVGINDVTVNDAIRKWRNGLNFKVRELFRQEEGGLYYTYIGSKLVIDKDFNENYPGWVRFSMPINVVVINVPSLDGISDRIGAIQSDTLHINNYMKTSLPRIPYCKNLYINNCPRLNTIPDFLSLDTLVITKCPKLNSWKSISNLTSILLNDCDGITNLLGLGDSCKGSVTIIGCKNFNSMEGCPKTIKGDLTIIDNINLTSLEGFPSKVTGTVVMRGNGRIFTKDEIIGKCNARKVITQ